MMIRKHLADNAPWDVIEQYQAFCDERGVTMLEATFAWLLAQPGLTSVIAGATKPEQIVQNAEAATAWKPTRRRGRDHLGAVRLSRPDAPRVFAVGERARACE